MNENLALGQIRNLSYFFSLFLSLNVNQHFNNLVCFLLLGRLILSVSLKECVLNIIVRIQNS